MKNYNSPTVQEYLEQKQELKEKKNQTILQMRQEGYSLQAIGDKFNCSREWIRKVLKKEFDIIGCVSFDPRKETMSDEYSAFDLADITGYNFHYINNLIKKEWLPNFSRTAKRHKYEGIIYCYWKKTDIDKWIKIKIKYLKIALEGYINQRLAYPYKFSHIKIQKRYKILTSLDSEGWKGKLSYNSNRSHLVMKEFNNLITPLKYVPTDYSKYLNMRSKEHFAEKGLHNGAETTAMIDVSGNVLCRYRRSGVLKEGVHYFAGDHYHHRYMYDPKKTKKAILDAGFNLVIQKGQKERWAKRGNK